MKTIFSKEEQASFIILIAVAVALVMIVIGVTMWLVPWGSMTAAGILLTIGIFFTVGALLLTVRTQGSKHIEGRGLSRKDEAVKNARDNAFSLVGKAALFLTLFVSLLLIVTGQIGSPVFFLCSLGFLLLAVSGLLAILYFYRKL